MPSRLGQLQIEVDEPVIRPESQSTFGLEAAAAEPQGDFGLQVGTPEILTVVPQSGGEPVRVARTAGLDWDRVKDIAGQVTRGALLAHPAAGLWGVTEALNNPAAGKVAKGVASVAQDTGTALLPSTMAAMHGREAALDQPQAPAPAIDPRTLALPPASQALPPQAPAPGGGARRGGGQPKAAIDAERKQFDDSFNQQQQALAAGTNAGLARVAEEETAARESLAAEQRLAAEALERQRIHKADRDEALKQLKGSYEALSRGPDPDRFWASRSTGQKVMAGIGMALGVFGGAGQGGGNAGVEAINNAIQKDIELQQRSLQTGVAGRESLLGQMRQAFGDDVEALAATRANTLAIAEAKLKDIAARAAAPEMKAKAMDLAGQLEQKRLEAWQDVLDRRQERSLKFANVQRLRAEAMAPRGGESGEDLRKRFVPGIGLALDPDAAKTVRAKTAGFQKVKGELRKLIEFRQQFGAEGLDRKALAEAKVHATQLQLALKEDGALGALDKGSQEVLGRLVTADPGEIGPVLSQLEALNASIDQGYRATLTPYMDPSGSQIPDTSASLGARRL